jgi:hypothetical protein
MSVSMLATREAAASRARLFPKLGTHVAELRLSAGNGFVFAETMHPGHISVWGDPFKLDASVTDRLNPDLLAAKRPEGPVESGTLAFGQVRFRISR